MEGLLKDRRVLNMVIEINKHRLAMRLGLSSAENRAPPFTITAADNAACAQHIVAMCKRLFGHGFQMLTYVHFRLVVGCDRATTFMLFCSGDRGWWAAQVRVSERCIIPASGSPPLQDPYDSTTSDATLSEWANKMMATEVDLFFYTKATSANT